MSNETRETGKDIETIRYALRDGVDREKALVTAIRWIQGEAVAALERVGEHDVAEMIQTIYDRCAWELEQVREDHPS